MNREQLRAWIGRQQTQTDVLTPRLVQGLSAVLDLSAPQSDESLTTLGAHFLLAPPIAPQSQLGTDGHPAKGDFLPPIELPQRMWAGGRLVFAEPLPLGKQITKRSIIEDLQFKQGRSGPLVFVKLRYQYWHAETLCVTEYHDIVYRGPASKAPAHLLNLKLPTCDWQDKVKVDPVMLFRYSALTFNGHRIHYDRRYCQEEESYPGLVVHGPLIATLMLKQISQRWPGQGLSNFEFKNTAPLFDLDTFIICGCLTDTGAKPRVKLWALREDGTVAVTASAQLAENAVMDQLS